MFLYGSFSRKERQLSQTDRTSTDAVNFVLSRRQSVMTWSMSVQAVTVSRHTSLVSRKPTSRTGRTRPGNVYNIVSHNGGDKQ